MKNENVTDIEQSKRLEELIGDKGSDMFWSMALVKVGKGEFEDQYTLNYGKICCASSYPAWSFGALVDLLPEGQLEVWHINSLTMYEGYSCWTNSPVCRHCWNGKTKLEAVFNAVIDIYERREEDD